MCTQSKSVNQCDLLCMVWTRGWNMCLVLQWNLPAMIEKFGTWPSPLQHSAGEVLDADTSTNKSIEICIYQNLTSTRRDGKNCKNSCSAVFGKGFPFNERYRFHSWKVGFELERLIDAAFLRWYRQPLICHTPVKFMMVLRDFSIDCKTPNDNNILRSRKNPPPPPNSQRHVTGIPPWKLTSPMEYDGWKMKFPYINFPGGGGILEVKILISWIHPEPSPAINRINPSRIKVFQLSL